jgi:SAM-dependent methyltransferase
LSGVVADFGCSHGACTIIASENTNIREIIGVDINRDSLEIANDLISQHGVKKIKYLHSNLTDLAEIPSNYFDNAFSFHTLEHIHIDDYDLVFSEWKRVIKNEGHFIVSVPYEHAYDDPCHMNYFNETSISDLFIKYGFKISEVYRDNRYSFDCLNLVCKNIKQEHPLLSILVCSLVERNNTFLCDLISTIEKQVTGYERAKNVVLSEISAPRGLPPKEVEVQGEGEVQGKGEVQGEGERGGESHVKVKSHTERVCERSLFDEDGQDDEDVNSENDSHGKYKAEFIQFWNTYDKKQDLFKVRKKFNSLKPDEVKAILIHVPKYVASTSDKKFRKNPLTYLNGRCWEDEIQNEGPKFYNENNRPWNGW